MAPVEVYGGEHVVTAVRGDQVVGRALRTAWGWHIPLRSQPRTPTAKPRRRWATAATAYDAAQLLYRLHTPTT